MEKYECEINIDDDGSCTILSGNQDSIDSVIKHIDLMTYEPKVDDVINAFMTIGLTDENIFDGRFFVVGSRKLITIAGV